MLSLQLLASRIAIEKNCSIPNGVILETTENNYEILLDIANFVGFDIINRCYPTKFVSTEVLHSTILDNDNIRIKGLIYGTKAPFFCDNWSHTIISNDIHVVANCAKTCGYILDSDFKTGFLSFMSGYTACIY